MDVAAAIRQLAGVPRAARAVPAVLGCLEAALHELSGACEAMEETTERAAHPRPRTGAEPALDAVAARMRRGFSNLERALFEAEAAAVAARSLAVRSLGG